MWYANTAGVSQSVVPKHSFTVDGLNWFPKNGLAYSRQQVANGKYTPKPGDIIYFKGSRNSNKTNHVGIVKSYSNKTVYTIEVNKDDAVKSCSYSISNNYIVYIGFEIENIDLDNYIFFNKDKINFQKREISMLNSYMYIWQQQKRIFSIPKLIMKKILQENMNYGNHTLQEILMIIGTTF